MKYFVHLGLALLLVLTIAAMATAAVWNFAPELVQRVDNKWVTWHTSTIQNRIDELREQSKIAPQKAARGLEALRRDLSGYEKADRRYPLRRRALRLLADLYFTRERPEDAEPVGGELVKLDKNDIGTRLWYGVRLSNYGTTEERGLKELRQLFEMVPEAGVLARSYVEALIRLDEPRLAARALSKHVERALRPDQSMEALEGSWQVWWSSSSEFERNQSVLVQAQEQGGSLQLQFDIPEGAKTIRLDPPPRSRFASGAHRATLDRNGVLEPWTIPMDKVALHDMFMDEAMAYTFGDVDPYVTIPLPTELQRTNFKVRLELDLNRLPHWIGKAAARLPLQAMIEQGELEPATEAKLGRALEESLDVTGALTAQDPSESKSR